VELGDTMGTGIVVKSGLQPGSRVIVDGLQKVQPGMTANVSMTEAEK
jgi:membrane fusion protein (multidrug efflux system)